MSQVQISAGQVKELRDRTGAGMMAAKRALEETSGDIEAAQRLLREQGMAAADKRAGRATTEGKVLSTISGNMGVLVAIGCETEPVSNTREFLDFTEAVLEAVESRGAEAAEGFEEQRLELVGRLGEQVEIRGAARLEAGEGELLAEYVHRPAEKIGVLVKTRGAEPAFARRLGRRALQLAEPDRSGNGRRPAREASTRRFGHRQGAGAGRPAGAAVR